jgi:hypothetical protein
MATKQWDHKVPFWIKNQHRRVDALPLNQGSNQPSDGSDRPHHKNSLAWLPLMGKLRLQIGIMRNDALDMALISESFEEDVAAGGKAKPRKIDICGGSQGFLICSGFSQAAVFVQQLSC